MPIQSQTSNKWFTEHGKQIGVNKRLMNRDVAVFTSAACIGFEEIFRNYILSVTKVANNEGIISRPDTIQTRDFTGVCDSIKAEVLFLNLDVIMPIIKIHDIALIE